MEGTMKLFTLVLAAMMALASGGFIRPPFFPMLRPNPSFPLIPFPPRFPPFIGPIPGPFVPPFAPKRFPGLGKRKFRSRRQRVLGPSIRSKPFTLKIPTFEPQEVRREQQTGINFVETQGTSNDVYIITYDDINSDNYRVADFIDLTGSGVYEANLVDTSGLYNDRRSTGDVSIDGNVYIQDPGANAALANGANAGQIVNSALTSGSLRTDSLDYPLTNAGVTDILGGSSLVVNGAPVVSNGGPILI